jgi:predicted translation initiation factor SUI1
VAAPPQCRGAVLPQRRFLARGRARRSPHPMAMTLTIRRETAGRKGREVTTVAGLAPLGAAKIADLASALKKRCASGGSVEPPGTIVLQGDHRDLVEAELIARGFTVKRAGG